MLRRSLAILLAFSSVAAAQELAPDPPIEIELDATDPVLAGHGFSRAVPWTAEVVGTLHAWVASDAVDPLLRIEEAEGGALVAEDGDSGGATNAYVALEVERGRRLLVRVASTAAGVSGRVELHLGLAPAIPAARTAAAEAQAAVQEARQLSASRESAAARSKMCAALDTLLGTPGVADDERAIEALFEFNDLAFELEDDQARLRALPAVIEHRRRFLPPEHHELVRAEIASASSLVYLGDAANARAAFERLLATLGRLPPDHRDRIVVRYYIARCRRALGEVEAACAELEELASLAERTLGSDSDELQYIRQSLVPALQDLGRGERILEIERQVLEHFRRTRPSDDPQLLLALENVAASLSNRGDRQGGAALTEEVVRGLEQRLGEGSPQLATARVNLASDYNALGRTREAHALLERALPVLEATLLPEEKGLLGARSILASVLQTLGRTEDALAEQQGVLAVRARVFPADHPDVLESQREIAGLLTRLGRKAEARRILEGIVSTLTSRFGATHASALAARRKLVATLQGLGDMEGAREVLDELLEASRGLAREDPERIEILQTRSDFLFANRAFEESLAADRECLARLQGRLPEDHPTLLRLQFDIAIALSETGDPQGAVRDLRLLVASAERNPNAEEILDEARVALAIALYHAHAYDEASALWKQAEEYGSQIPGREFAVMTLVADRTMSEARAGRMKEARAAFLDTSERMVIQAREVVTTCSLRSAAASSDTLRERVDGLLMLLDPTHWPAPPREVEEAAFQMVESLRGAGLRAARLVRAARTDAACADALEDLSAAKSALVRAVDAHATAEEIAARRLACEQLERQLVASSSARASPWTEVSAPALAARLAPDQALVCTWSATDSVLAFVLRHDGELARIDLGSRDELRARCERWRRALAAEIGVEPARGVGVPAAPPDVGTSPGAEVARIVLEPLRAHLDRVRRLIVVPDDALLAVPLDALPWDDGLLGERLAVEVHTTAWELLAEEEPCPEGPFVGFGGIDYDAQGKDPDRAAAAPDLLACVAPERVRAGLDAGRFVALPATRDEVREVAALALVAHVGSTAPKVFEGAEASVESLDRLAPSVRILHVATHGWFADDEELSKGRAVGSPPMARCGLALAGANADGSGSSGLITAEELAVLDLSHCELAVLSACETSRGVLRQGEGAASLQQALHMAGARSVITSLWKVPDEATKDLMADFYRRIWIEKESKAQALWEAKLRLRDARDEDGQPLYTTRDWAAWVLTGEQE